jgi:hypothetical protein
VDRGHKESVEPSAVVRRKTAPLERIDWKTAKPLDRTMPQLIMALVDDVIE